MNERQIRDVIVKLMPAMSKGSPEEPLLKYARQNNLSPAQLERLGVVANSFMTLEAAKTAAVGERPVDIPLIDVQDMLVRYTDARIPEKVAQVLRAEQRPAFSVGDHFQAEAPQEKAAAASETGTRPGEFTHREVANTVHNIEHALACCSNLRHEYRAKLATAVTGMLGRVENNRAKMLPVLIDDVRLLSEKQASAIVDSIRRTVEHQRGWYFDFAKQASVELPTFTLDRLKVAGFVSMAEQALDYLDALDHVQQELQAEKAAVLSATPPTSTPTEQPKQQDDGQLEHIDLSQPGPTDTPEAVENAVDIALTRLRLQSRISPGQVPAPSSLPVDNRAQGEGGFVHDSMSGAGQALSGAVQAGNTVAGGLRQTIDTLLSANPGEHAARTAEGYKALVDPKADQRVEKVRTAMRTMQQRVTLARLLNTDEILKKHPPAVVQEAFETLRNRAPDLASDIQTARTILREAVNYQGVPLSSIKTMSDLSRAKPSTTNPVT